MSKNKNIPIATPEMKDALKKQVAEAIGERVRKVRKEKGMSGEQLSHYLDTSRQAVHKIENGEYNFTIVTVYLIARALECDVHDLIPSEI